MNAYSNPTAGVVALAVVCGVSPARAADSVGDATQRSDVVLVADVVVAETVPFNRGGHLGYTVTQPGGKVGLTADRVLKGRLKARHLVVRMSPEMARDGFESRALWFLKRRADGEFDPVVAPRGDDVESKDMVARSVRRSFPGLEAVPAADGLILTLGIDSRMGSATKNPKPIDRRNLLLVAQLTNFGASRVVTPPLDGSKEGRRYPKVLLEIRNQSGRTPPMRGRGMCGNMNPFALNNFVELGVGQALTFTIESDQYLLGPGRYKARLRYVASRALDPRREPKVERSALSRFGQLWEGTVESNWVTFTINPDGADEASVDHAHDLDGL
jgi:hypothetical protein